MKKVVEHLDVTQDKIDSNSFDVHWYRRVFHAFGACFLFYYMLPDTFWLNLLKFWVPIFIIVFAVLLEISRLKGFISSDYFFGLRNYEKKRFGSYLFFGFALFILLMFFPQQIAIPCILCGCFADPIIGEARFRFSKIRVYFIGFLICVIFFMVSWLNADLWLILLVSFVGASGALVGEIKKFWWLDDDFIIQILPAVLLVLLFLILTQFGFEITFEQIIYPGNMPW